MSPQVLSRSRVVVMLFRIALLAIAGIAVALPAYAGERPRLVVGGMDLSQQSIHNEVFSSGNFSVGTVSGDGGAGDHGSDRLTVGGYAAYAFQEMQLSSSLKGNTETSAADFGATYSGGMMGLDGVAALRLGYEWGQEQRAFSVNPAQAGLTAFNGAYDPNHTLGDLSLTLSFSHDVTPGLSLGGFAAASRSDQDGEHTQSSLRFGAGLGLKF